MLIVLAWVPMMVSAILIGVSWITYWIIGGAFPRTLALLTVFVLIAAYLQLSGKSLPMTTVGLVLQVLLAVTLIVRLKAGSG